MGNDIEFTADTSQLERYARFWERRAPKQTQHATARVLSNIAFEARKSAIVVIGEEMTIRNKRFVESALKFVKANGRQAVNQQESHMGSIAKARFSGWIEQQFGVARGGKHAHSLRARGNKKRQVRKKYRFKSGMNIPAPTDARFAGPGAKWQRTWRMLHMLRREGWVDKPFFIWGTRHIKRGAYIMTGGGRLKFIASIGPPEQPAKLPWIEMAVKRTLRRYNIKKAWRREFRAQLLRKYRSRR